MEKKLFLAAMLCAQMLGMQVMAQTIATVRTASIGSTVTVRGIVTNGSELGSIRYVQDGTAGIAIYGSNLSSLQRGDSVVATGRLDYNLLEVTPVRSFTHLGPQTLPAFQTITVPQMNETVEGELVRFDNCTFAMGGGTFAGNTNYNVTTGGQTLQVRIGNTSPLVGTVIPAAAVHLTGIASQFCVNPTSGCTTGYQLLLRDANDILQISTIFITAATTQTNISTTSFDLNWSTNVAGTNSYLQYGTTPALTGGTVTANNATNHTVTLTSLSPATVYCTKAYSVLDQDAARDPDRSILRTIGVVGQNHRLF